MILIDTDHATFLKYPESERGRRLIERLTALPPSEIVGTAIITVEERMRGWLAVIAKEALVLLVSASFLIAFTAGELRKTASASLGSGGSMRIAAAIPAFFRAVRTRSAP